MDNFMTIMRENLTLQNLKIKQFDTKILHSILHKILNIILTLRKKKKKEVEGHLWK